jgi:serpin B
MNRREFCLSTGSALLGLGLANSAWPRVGFGAEAGADAGVLPLAINALGLELLAKTAANDNALLSPFSIQAAFAMTWAGADGETRAEMAKVLHYPDTEEAVHNSYRALKSSLEAIADRSARAAQRLKEAGGKQDAIRLAVANRLFGQKGYAFRPAFLSLTKDTYNAPLEMCDFEKNAPGERRKINGWVEEQTNQRIRDLIPPDGLTNDTRLVLVNAIFFKAPWAHPFTASQTRPAPFNRAGGGQKEVPTMRQKQQFGYLRQDGYTAVTLPYSEHDLQLLVLMPDAGQKLESFAARVTPELLAASGAAPAQEILLSLPKFKLEPGAMRLAKILQSLGMRTAFDVPPGSANFDRMAPRRPQDYLYISEAFHKTFLELDEQGTEAAAATAVVMMRATAAREPGPEPIEVRIDRPFLFAIQHRPTGACLFLGRLTNPA